MFIEAIKLNSYLQAVAALIYLCLMLPMPAHALAWKTSITPARYSPGARESFWVPDLSKTSAGPHKIRAVLAAIGARSYIFVQENLMGNQVKPAQLQSLADELEVSSNLLSRDPGMGIIPLDEKIFAPLPTAINADARVIILIADLRSTPVSATAGFFSEYDQMSDSVSWAQFHQHSNQTNIIYINTPQFGLPLNANRAAATVAHEVEYLVAYGARGAPPAMASQESWLGEVEAKSALLFNGFFTDQAAINEFAEDTTSAPLVTQSYVNYGLSTLFAAYMVDRLGGYGGLDQIIHFQETGRAAVENAFFKNTGFETSFDAIYNDFISYLFDASENKQTLPLSWSLPAGKGLHMPPIKRARRLGSIPTAVEGAIYPYTFVVYQLAAELPDNAIINVEVLNATSGNKTKKQLATDDCDDDLKVLWKPLGKAIAIYALGCKFGDDRDLLKYRLSIYTMTQPVTSK